VGHEATRTFDDQSQSTIASLHGEDDSPLGLDFPVAGAASPLTASATFGSQTFTGTYPKWGTVVALADVTGDTPRAAAAHQKFLLPLTLRWIFQKGTDFPRVDVSLDLSAVTAGQLAFDVRGPYGVIEFADGDGNATLNNVQWGDSAYHFTTLTPAAADLTTQRGWTWNEPIGTARAYQALLARHSITGELWELGLLEQRLGGEGGLAYSGYAPNRGLTSAGSGHALLSDAFADWEWPFQSAQYDGVAATPTTGKKFAWGSSPFYGSANTVQYLNDTTSVPLVGKPASGRLTYRVCVVLGRSPFTDGARVSLTRASATAASVSCASSAPLP
jgi:hypothetical protein